MLQKKDFRFVYFFRKDWNGPALKEYVLAGFKKNLFVLGLYEFLVNLESKILWFILVKSHCGLGKANKDTRLFKLTLRSLIAKPSEDRHMQDFLSSRINAFASLEIRFLGRSACKSL